MISGDNRLIGGYLRLAKPRNESKFRGGNAEYKNRNDSVDYRNGRTDCNKRIHIGRAAEQFFEPADKISSVNYQDGYQQNKLNERIAYGVSHMVEHVGRGEAPHHIAHRKIHKRDKQRGGNQQFYKLFVEFLFCFAARRTTRRTTRRTAVGFICFFAAAERRRITDFIDAVFYIFGRTNRFVVFYRHVFHQQIDVYAFYARGFLNRFFHMSYARRATHSGNVK